MRSRNDIRVMGPSKVCIYESTRLRCVLQFTGIFAVRGVYQMAMCDQFLRKLHAAETARRLFSVIPIEMLTAIMNEFREALSFASGKVDKDITERRPGIPFIKACHI